MQIQTIPNYPTNTKPKNLNFKSVYPVVHWVKNSKNCFYPEFNYHNAKDLSEKIIIKLLNEKPVVIKNKILELTKKLLCRDRAQLLLRGLRYPFRRKPESCRSFCR